MIIQNMFVDDINREINGVVKVDQDENKVLEQELNEYVITRELKKHFNAFFNNYSEAFDQPTADTGVWISGFFGSGKSHFLKMLSYLLENREVNGIRTVERFRKKFEDDPADFMMVDRSTKGETETILFNIDYEGSINKDKTAVLRVFAKVFYNHLGFLGSNLKVAMLEQYIAQQGKMEEFCRLIEEKKGKPWTEVRKAFAFNGKVIKPALVEALDMSEGDAENWFNDKSAAELSIAQLVDDINAYVSTKPADFRLLFMADEVGQYVGTDTDMLLNLQSLVEKIGSECRGKVWVVCTGQEAIDEIIKVRADEFSRIQARFKTRLSLSSSSVDEVIQKRILKKTPEAEKTLDAVYEKESSGMRNLFSFTNAMPDIKGFSGPTQFTEDFPFIPYQFLIMQKIFAEIRKHGNAGKHFSGAERSMLSGFQEAAQKVQDRSEYAIVPLFRFYDTVHSFLDTSIRNVIERCGKAAENHDGLEKMDVDVLKLLYLIRYVNEDIPANLDNLVILMADDIRLEKVAMREKLRGSLDRLMSCNYIGRTGDTYNFLTDEEQDIQKEINRMHVDTGAIVGHLAQIIFGEIYDNKKFHYGKCDFPFDQLVDNTRNGTATDGMRLRFLTEAADAAEKTEFRLMNNSKGSEAIVVLAETPYYKSMEDSLKIRKYVKQRNVSQLSKSVQEIIRRQQDEATKYEAEAGKALRDAIENAQFYADGEHLDIKNGNAKAKIDQAMEYLVSHVYSKLDLIGKNADSDADILAVLSGADYIMLEADPNRDAEAAVEEYLAMQAMHHLPTSMADVQSKFGNIPYGWKEIDIALVVARLIVNQKVTIRYAGTTIQPDNAKLPDMLRKKSEVGKTSISKRVVVSAAKVKQVRELLRDYFDVMDVPADEDGLVKFITDKFSEQLKHFEELDKQYDDTHKYPDQAMVRNAKAATQEVLNQKKDNIALIDYLLKKEDDLFDQKDDMNRVENFFRSQVGVFNEAARLERELQADLDRIAQNTQANDALNRIRLIITLPSFGQKYNYKRIPELNGLMQTVRAAHDEMLAEKRDEILETVRQCMEATHTAANGDPKAMDIIRKSDTYFDDYKGKIADCKSLALLDGMIIPLSKYKDDAISSIEIALAPPAPKPVDTKKSAAIPAAKRPKVKSYSRQILFPAKTLRNDADIDAYVEKIREQLRDLLDNCDEIKLN